MAILIIANVVSSVLFNVLKPMLFFLEKASSGIGLLARKLGEYAVAHTHISRLLSSVRRSVSGL